VADTRLLHKRGSHGERIISLSDLTFRVWIQYVLSADDFGVMRASASVLRADNPRLEREPLKRINKAMAEIVLARLVEEFVHQGVRYWWQLDWNDFQKIRYPRETVNPFPSEEEVKRATEKTRELFRIRADSFRSDFRNISEMTPQPARARGREALTPTQTPTPSGSMRLILEESPRETKPAERPLRPGRGGLTGRHNVTCDAATWVACERGLCVPPFIAAEWRQASVASGTDADTAIRDMLTAWSAAIRDGTVLATPKPAEYWRAVWARWHGDAADRVRRSDSRSGHTVAEGMAYLADIAAKVDP